MSVFAFILLLPSGHRRSRMGIGWAEAAVGGAAERSGAGGGEYGRPLSPFPVKSTMEWSM